MSSRNSILLTINNIINLKKKKKINKKKKKNFEKEITVFVKNEDTKILMSGIIKREYFKLKEDIDLGSQQLK